MTAEQGTSAARTPTPIDGIAEKWVETLADLMPTLATYIGLDRGKLGEWEDFSPAGADAAADAAKAVIAELTPVAPVDDVDKVTKDDLLSTLKLELEKHDLGFHLRDVNVLASPVQTIRETYDIMPTDTEGDWANISSRLNSAPTAIDQYIETLRLGIERGVVPAKRQVLEVIVQSRETADPDGLFSDLVGGASGISDGLTSDLRKGAAASARAYATLADFFEKELLPVAGDKDAVGRDLYAVASRAFLGATVDLDETYEWGVEELQRMVDEQTSIANEIKPGASVEEAIEFLNADASRKLHGTEALQKWMQETSDRADLGARKDAFRHPGRDPHAGVHDRAQPHGNHLLHRTDRRLLPPGSHVVVRARGRHRVRHLARIDDGLPRGRSRASPADRRRPSTTARRSTATVGCSRERRATPRVGALRRTSHGRARVPRRSSRPSRHARRPAHARGSRRARHRRSPGEAAPGRHGRRGRATTPSISWARTST